VFLGTSLSVWQVLAILVICSAVAIEACWDKLFSREVETVD